MCRHCRRRACCPRRGTDRARSRSPFAIWAKRVKPSSLRVWLTYEAMSSRRILRPPSPCVVSKKIARSGDIVLASPSEGDELVLRKYMRIYGRSELQAGCDDVGNIYCAQVRIHAVAHAMLRFYGSR